MNERLARPTPDPEEELARYLLEQRLTRRQLLDRIAKVGAVAALAPIVAACRAGGGASSASPSAAASATASATPLPTASPSPTPVPPPEKELFVYNWTEYIGDKTIPTFEKKYAIKVTYDFFANTTEAYAKLGTDGGGYDISFPTSVDIPSFVAKGALRELDMSLLPNIKNLGPEWANPGYDPGNKHSIPYMWWTTGVGYDTRRVKDSPKSSKALWDPRWKGHLAMLDDYQEVFGMALIQLGYSANSTNTTEMDAALALLKQQKPLVRLYSTDTVTTMTSGDIWIGHMWGSDLYAIQQANANIAYYIPQEGGIRGSDTMAIFTGAKHPIAAHLFINYMLDAQVSADNTNFIGYMGPNLAAQQFISPDILADPAVNPDKAILSKLEELLDLGNTVRDEYLARWQELRG